MTPIAVPPPPPITSPSPAGPARDRAWRRRGARTAWVVFGSLFTVAALAWGALEAVGLIAHHETTEVHSWEAAGIATIVVDNDGGDVHVSRGNASTIELTSQISRGLFDTDHSEHVEGDRLVLRTNCPNLVNHFCRVDMDLTVPDGIAVEIRSQHGTTSVRGLDAGVAIDAQHGRVELARLSGTLDLRMAHGSLSATGLTSDEVVARSEHGRMDLTFASTPRSLVVRSEFGDVDVTLPDDGSSVALTSTSEFASIDNQLRVDSASPSRVEVHVEFGRVTLGYAG